MLKDEVINHMIFVVLFVLFVLCCLYVYKVKGKMALITLIQKAEYIFDWEGTGKEKAKYVLAQAQKKVPAPYKYFLNIKVINRIVDTLQKDFKEVKEYKKSKEYQELKDKESDTDGEEVEV